MTHPRVQLLQEILDRPATEVAIRAEIASRAGRIGVTYGASLSLYMPLPCVTVTVTRDGAVRTAILANPPPEMLCLNVVEVVRGMLGLMDYPTAKFTITTPEEPRE